jgi:hypothetical protein
VTDEVVNDQGDANVAASNRWLDAARKRHHRDDGLSTD